MNTTNPYLIKCAALASKEESKPEQEEAPNPENPHAPLPTLSAVARDQKSIAQVLLDKTAPTLSDLARPI